jgi:hypothetical protein
MQRLKHDVDVVRAAHAKRFLNYPITVSSNYVCIIYIVTHVSFSVSCCICPLVRGREQNALDKWNVCIILYLGNTYAYANGKFRMHV